MSAAVYVRYVPCDEREVAGGVRWDVPARNQGQMVEIAYGGHARGEHDDGAPYRRVTDRSSGEVTYYRLPRTARSAWIPLLERALPLGGNGVPRAEVERMADACIAAERRGERVDVRLVVREYHS